MEVVGLTNLEQLKQAIMSYGDKILFAYLFGSAAAGSGGSMSDIDLAVYFNSHRRDCQMMRIDLYVALSRALRRNDLDIVILNTASNLVLVDNIIRHGVLIVDRGRELRESYELKVLHRAIDFKAHRKRWMGI